MIKIILSFLRLGNAPLIAFIKTLLNRLATQDDFSDELKKEVSKLEQKVTDMHEISISIIARKGELTRVARKKVEDQVRIMISILEMEVNDRDLHEVETRALVHGLGLRTRRKMGAMRPRTLCAWTGQETGSVRLRTQGQADVYEWWYTADTIHHSAPVYQTPTVVANTVVRGLSHGLYAFFSKTHRRNEPPVVEGPVLFFVV